MSAAEKDCGCPERATKFLTFAEAHSVPMPRFVRRHLEKTAARAHAPNDGDRVVELRKRPVRTKEKQA